MRQNPEFHVSEAHLKCFPITGNSSSVRTVKKTLTIWWVVLTVGVLLMLGSLLGVVETIIQMQEVMQQVAPNADPATVSEGLSKSLMSTYIGMGAGSLGIVLVTTSTVGLILSYNQKRKRLQRPNSRVGSSPV
jgi:hypothetical protein